MDSSRLTFVPSIAGIWQFVHDSHVTPGNGGHLGNAVFANVSLSPMQQTGVLMIGWQYSGFDNSAAQVTPVQLGILEPQTNGTMLLKTSTYVSSPTTNGTHSVVVHDFNGDGRDDVFLPAHNESPFVLAHSTLLLSNPAGTFETVALSDAVMAHDARLGTYRGEPLVVTSGLAGPGQGNPASPTYRWDGSKMIFANGAVRDSHATAGSSVQLGDFDGDGIEELVIADVFYGPGYPWSPQNHTRIAVYSFDGVDITGSSPRALLTPWVETHFPSFPSEQGPGVAHTPRVWVEDFNHDGKPDIMTMSTLWNHSNNEWPTMLQMLQNKSAFQFSDVTDALNPAFSPFTDLMDYNMQVIDLDGSGIHSFLSGHAAPRTFDGTHYVGIDSRQSNWLLVNDGSGRLHVALHDEFVAMGHAVLDYAASLYNDPHTLFVEVYQGTPRMHGYLTADGLLNFVAEVQTFRIVDGVNHANKSVLVNVPVGIDLRTDFTDAITIGDRNGSGRLRTFAGDDMIHDNNAAPSATIDGGLGVDTMVYGAPRSTYTVAPTAGGHNVSGHGIFDALSGIERLRFSDSHVALDLHGNAGTVARIIGTVFGPAAVQDPVYVGIGLRLADGGMGASGLMELALGVAVPAASDAQFVERLYTNVVGNAPSAGELQAFVGMLEAGATRVSLGLLAAETPMNAQAIGLFGLAATGLEYL